MSKFEICGTTNSTSGSEGASIEFVEETAAATLSDSKNYTDQKIEDAKTGLVTSVNGKTNDVVLKTSDLENDAKFEESQTNFVREKIESISDEKSLFQYFFALRKSTQRKFLFEISKDGVHENIISALGGRPDGVSPEESAYLFIVFPFSEAGGFLIVARYQLKNALGIYTKNLYETYNTPDPIRYKTEWIKFEKSGSSYVLPTATETELGGILAEPALPSDTKKGYIGADKQIHFTPDVLVVQATQEAGQWVSDAGSETIRSFGGDVILKAEVNGVPYIYRYQRYGSATDASGTYTGAVFDQPNISANAVERIEVVIDRDRKVYIVRTPFVPQKQKKLNFTGAKSGFYDGTKDTELEIATNATLRLLEPIPEITDLRSFQTWCYNQRKSAWRNFQMEISPDGIWFYILSDILGFPDGWDPNDTAFLYVTAPFSESGGFVVDLKLEGRKNSKFYKMLMWSTNNGTWYKTEWNDQINPVLLDKTLTQENKAADAKAVGDALKEKADVVRFVEMTEAAAEISPNVFYKWGEMASLKITLGTETPDILNEYMFQFSSPLAAPTTLDLPAEIKWQTVPVIETGKTYQISVVNLIGVVYGV